MKTAFVLAGGGAAGSYQLGCLKAIYQHTKIRPDFITANSAGTLNAVGLSYAGLEELEKMWRSITRRQDIFGDRYFGWLQAVFGADSLWVSKPLRKKLEAIMYQRSPKIPLWANYVDLRDGKLIRAHSTDGDLLKKYLASASLPVVTEPVDGHLVDGGVRENTPLSFAIEQGADRILVFLNSPKDEEARMPFQPKFDNVKQIAARALTIMSDEMYWQDVELCRTFNECNIGRPIELHWFCPEKSTIDTLDFKAEKINQAIEQGFSETVVKIAQMKLG